MPYFGFNAPRTIPGFYDYELKNEALFAPNSSIQKYLSQFYATIKYWHSRISYFRFMNLSEHLFWDTDPLKVDMEKHARKIIERVVSRGRLEDWFQIKEYYGLERIKEEVIQIRSLDDKTHTFLATILNIPKENFRCYSNRLLNQPHFPY